LSNNQLKLIDLKQKVLRQQPLTLDDRHFIETCHRDGATIEQLIASTIWLILRDDKNASAALDTLAREAQSDAPLDQPCRYEIAEAAAYIPLHSLNHSPILFFLFAAISDPHIPTRINVSYVLSNLSRHGNTHARKILERYQDDPDLRVRKNATRAVNDVT
jgi:hypothetical protein